MKAPTPPPAELAATSPIQEMPSPGVAKYMSMQQQPDSRMHPAYSGPTSLHSRSPSDDYNSPAAPYPPQQYQSTSPTTAAPYPSPYGPDYPHQNGYAPYSDNPNAYDTQTYDANAYPPPSAAAQQRQYTYPSPHSPSHPPFAPTQQQVYYPPPPEPSTHSHSHHSHSRSHHSFSDRMASPEGTQYSGSTETGPMPPSTTNTPAQFYAQPVPVNGQHLMTGAAGAGHSPGGYGGEGGVKDDGSFRGSIDSRRRPVRGRFVEVDHM